jgi:hypothetical protein
MRQLGSDRDPVRLIITDDPSPKVVIREPDTLGDGRRDDGHPCEEVDVTSAVERIMWEMTPQMVVAHLVLRVDLTADFPVHRLKVMTAGEPADPLEGITPEAIDEAISEGGYSTSIGRTVYDWLQAKIGGIGT